MQEHYQTGSGILQSRPWEQDQAPWEFEDDPLLKNVYKANVPMILENHQESAVSKNVLRWLNGVAQRVVEMVQDEPDVRDQVRFPFGVGSLT
jgi:hypothetical protein